MSTSLDTSTLEDFVVELKIYYKVGNINKRITIDVSFNDEEHYEILEAEDFDTIYPEIQHYLFTFIEKQKCKIISITLLQKYTNYVGEPDLSMDI